MVEERWYTVSEVARRLRVQDKTIRHWIHQGRIRAVRLPGRRSGWRISEQAVQEFLASLEQAGERRDE